ncbi:MAG: response regulator [Ilyomonas sp.]
MKNFFYRLPLPVKLTIVGLIPVIFLVYFASQIQKEKNDKLKVLETFISHLDRTNAIMDAINQLQSERRLSLFYAIRNQNEVQLNIQRKETDKALSDLQTIAEAQLNNFASYSFLNSLSDVRQQIDDKKLTAMQVMDYYTNVIFRINTFVNIGSATLPQLQNLNKDMVAQKIISEMSTYLGVMRAYIYFDYYYPEETKSILAEVKQINDFYNSYYTELEARGSATAVNDFKTISSSGELNETLNYINKIIEKGQIDSTYSSATWWDISAIGVDKMRKLQQNILAKVETNVNAVSESEQLNKELSLIFLIGIIALVVFIILYTRKDISDSLIALRTAAEKMALGNTGIKPVALTNDVIGNLAAAIAKIDDTNVLIAEAAESIGKGNFNIELQPRSEEDDLSFALIQMKNDLQHFRIKNEKEVWIQSGVTVISESILGEKSVYELSKDCLSTLAHYTNAKVGLFYSNLNGNLELASSFAVTDHDNIPKNIALGETVLGEAALHKKVVFLNDTIHSDSLKVSTGLTEVIPAHIAIIPLYHYKTLEGVIEIASLTPFESASEQLFKNISENIATALHAAKSRARLQELFEETQAQAEELQAQHNELEHLNTELEGQTQKLQVSEEELKVQQEELLQANQELEERSSLLEERNQLIVERNLEIQKKAEELERTTRYKSEFLANMSHELRTPLNSILLLSRLLYENNEQNLTQDQIEYAQVIQNSGNGLLALIDEILDLSKIEAGKMTLEYGSVSIKEIVDDIVALFKPMANQKNLQLKINIDPAVPSMIDTDQMRVEQVLKNLVSNSLKFTAKGSITLEVLSKGDLFISFIVRDTGIGISKDKQELIFEAFQQEDGSTRRKYGGTGLGLSISRELAKLLGGDIRLNSEPGKGSEFIVDVPVRRLTLKEIAEPGKAEPLLIEEDKKLPEKKAPANLAYVETIIPAEIPDDRNNIQPNDKVILIVEDDTLFAQALLGFTRQNGYKGLVAVRGDHGVEMTKKYKPMAVLLDIKLPVKDGWQVMEELKNNPQTRHIPVHIMSSLSFKKESLMKGAIDFISKPVALEQMKVIFQKIEEVLTRHPKKVLIIEENPKHASALSYFLQSHNINTHYTDNIDQSVNALQQKEVDCVVLDMGIPNQQSYETLEAIKKNEGLENLPIIIFTGKSLSRSEEQRIKQYADSIVVKTAHSYKRILDEVGLFLHVVEENKQQSNGTQYRRMGGIAEVLNNKTVLIADDDVRNIFSLTKALENHKMNVLSATDGKEALEVLQANPNVDIVLMDMMMPEMDGYEATATIRQKPQYRNLPILAVTAKAMTGDREKCIKAGASDYISKPVDIDQLLSLLRVWLYDKSK